MYYCSWGLFGPTTNPSKVLKRIKTKVHPLHTQMFDALVRMPTDKESMLAEQEKEDMLIAPIGSQRASEIKILTYNVQLIPKSVTGETYPCKYWDERISDLFTEGMLDDFDIVCL